jgi:aspartyl-tRNA(Asn)/glutamyl-tRNA(Gln) amidotransferase subunit A
VTRTPERYHPETLKRLKGGADLLAADYIVARRRVEDLRHATPTLFEHVDLLLTPTSPVLPMPIADLLADLDTLRPKEIKMLRNVRPWNALGLPSLSVPCGFTSTGLPIGLQIAGPAGGEARVLGLAQAYEAATEWHTRDPRGFETR